MSFSKKIFGRDEFERVYQNYKRSSQKHLHTKQTPKKLLEDYMMNIMKDKGRSVNLNTISSFKPLKKRMNEITNEFSRKSIATPLLLNERSRKTDFLSKFPSSGRSRSRSQKKYQQMLYELESPSFSHRKTFTMRENDPLMNYWYGRKKIEPVYTSELLNEFSFKREPDTHKKEPMRTEVKKLQLYIETMSDKEFSELSSFYKEELVRLAQTILKHKKSMLSIFK